MGISRPCAQCNVPFIFIFINSPVTYSHYQPAPGRAAHTFFRTANNIRLLKCSPLSARTTTLSHCKPINLKMDDPYTLLSLPRDATDSQIHKSYAQLSTRYHPDNAGPDYADYFEMLTAAYDSLIDETYVPSPSDKVPRKKEKVSGKQRKTRKEERTAKAAAEKATKEEAADDNEEEELRKEQMEWLEKEIERLDENVRTAYYRDNDLRKLQSFRAMTRALAAPGEVA